MSNTKKAAAPAATKGATTPTNGKAVKAPTRAEIDAQVLLELAKLEEKQALRGKRERFIDVRDSLEEVEIDLEREITDGSFDRSDYRLALTGGANLSLSISNPQIIQAFVEFLTPRINAKLAEINTELLK